MNIAVSYKDSDGIPRCGCPDLVTSGRPRKWAHNTLSYFIASRDEDLSQNTWDSIIAEAFDSWSRVANLKFVKIDKRNSANILVDIGSGQRHNFDGPKGTLAWAYLPSRHDYTGQLLMRFDTDEDWIGSPIGQTVIHEEQGTLLLNVAAHEIGHILGLGHSNIETALMAPYYAESVRSPQENDDIPRIQELYGKP